MGRWGDKGLLIQYGDLSANKEHTYIRSTAQTAVHFALLLIHNMAFSSSTHLPSLTLPPSLTPIPPLHLECLFHLALCLHDKLTVLGHCLFVFLS